LDVAALVLSDASNIVPVCGSGEIQFADRPCGSIRRLELRLRPEPAAGSTIP
jgi:hypothetical protein